ncbi:DMT family transporter [Sulfuriferula sp.]|uniref:DMT family transporter n=1 Tax=Sulfuriferula sp. TaxID=2025307 RepID=UPI0027315D51|nr:DMT family transporter [Sulfuriferula sp.]MDP2026994.1 DMT family transporter [Sulfuriferula sp.]
MKSSWMLVAGLLFAIMGGFVKLAASQFSSAELVFYRSLFGLLAIYWVIRTRNRTPHPFATVHWRAHLTRSVAGFIALLLFFHAIAELPLATAVTLNYTSPLFLALLLTFWQREKPHWPLLSALLLGFAGLILLLRPTLHADQLLTGLMGLGSGFLAGVAYFNLRQLGRLGEPDWRTVFYFTLVSSLGAGIVASVTGWHRVDLQAAGVLLGLGITATLAQLALTRAYRLGNALTVGGLAYSTVVFASLLGVLWWREVLPAGAWLGMGLIVASGVMSLRAIRPGG